MRHLIDPLDLSQQEITSLLDLADHICADPAAYQEVAAHKKLATLFYHPHPPLLRGRDAESRRPCPRLPQ